MSIINKIKHLASDASTWILAGMPVVDEETYQNRLHLCSMCPSLKNGSCEYCGCHMGSKAWLATAYCEDPAHPKWKSETKQ
jgi:hypothetical protein